MESSKKDLTSTLEAISGVPVLVVGDIILDRYVWGAVHRISPEAPVPVVEVRSSEDRLGGAGNVARNLRSLGAAVTMCGFVGEDEAADAVKQLMKEDGVSLQGLASDKGRPTSLKTRVIASHQQIVRIDREEVSAVSIEKAAQFADQVESQLAAHKVVILSDYGKGVVTEKLVKMLEDAKKKGIISLSKRPLVVDPHPANYGIYGSMSVAKPNRREAEVASGIKITSREKAIAAAQVLLNLWRADIMLITLGEDGLVMAFADKTPPIILETRARQVFDVSGAGDTVTAVFSAAIASGASPRLAGDLANIAAGLVVSEIGTVAVRKEKLVEAIAELNN